MWYCFPQRDPPNNYRMIKYENYNELMIFIEKKVVKEVPQKWWVLKSFSLHVSTYFFWYFAWIFYSSYNSINTKLLLARMLEITILFKLAQSVGSFVTEILIFFLIFCTKFGMIIVYINAKSQSWGSINTETKVRFFRGR